LGLNALDAASLEDQYAGIRNLVRETGGVRLLSTQDAAAIVDQQGKVTLKEHFGFTDGFGNPDYAGVCRATQPGQGKLVNGEWQPLATGELLLGHADEAGELPVAPVPHLLSANGTFMVYRKLHQNVGTFRRFLDTWATRYGAGDSLAREKLASKLIGRWRDGTPVERSPDRPAYAMTQDPQQSTNFTYADDPVGARCPVGAHVRRVNPRDAFGFESKLIDRRRITRRGMPYGPFADEFSDGTDPAEMDTIDRGVIFMALNASLSRQFEFVQQQWVNYGNDAHLGNERDLLIGNHHDDDRAMIQGDSDPANPPILLSGLPNFVELRGGDYFFLPSITGLGMLALGLVDPR
jgi:Dyp-type peroxidase family